MSAIATASAAATRRRIVRLLADRRGAVAIVLLLAAASTAATLAGPYLVGQVVDRVRAGEGVGAIDRLAALYAASAVAGGLLLYAAAVCAARLGEGALDELRREVFTHAVNAPAPALDGIGTGEMVSRVTGDVAVLSRTVRTSLPLSVFAVVETVAVVVALMLIDVRLALAAVAAGVPPAFIGARWYFRRAPARYRAERERHASLTSRLLDGYAGRATITALGAGRRYRSIAAAAGRATVDAELATTSARNRLRPAVELGLAAALAATIATGAALVRADAVTVGAVSAAALYAIRAVEPIGMLLEQLDELQQSTAAVARLVGIAELAGAAPSSTSPATGDESPATPVAGEAATGEVAVVDDVTYGYVTGRPVLRDVSLRIGAGERVAVVGASGAGKSTLVSLLSGDHRPTAGTVRVRGLDPARIDPATRRPLVAVVPQEAHVFAGTIADNLRFGRPDATATEMGAALTHAGADAWWPALPEGLDTRVGDGGLALDPGQAQQLGLARVLLADPQLVLLDEATSDLPASAAAATDRLLTTALRGRAVVMVAHRLDLAALADRILVLERGEVVASGAHDELLAADGTYADLWAHWLASRAPSASTG